VSDAITIDHRFRGPPESGNGGYVCGVVAGLIGGTAEVTLRRPPPLGRPLEVARFDGGGIALRDGETIVAEGVPTSVEIEVPEPVTFEEAVTAAKSYLGFRHHPFPTCFVCGPKRAEGDGLRIFPGWVAGRNIVAAPWTPDASLADEDGQVRPEIVWAALDCPSGFAVITPETVAVLGRLAARLLAPVRPSERCVVIGSPRGQDGRKMYSGTALFGEDGSLRAFARAIWVRIA
jgi:hypothetical protein